MVQASIGLGGSCGVVQASIGLGGSCGGALCVGLAGGGLGGSTGGGGGGGGMLLSIAILRETFEGGT